MTIAEQTRTAVRQRPFLLLALRCGVVNHRAAARELAVPGAEEDAVAAALRRFAAELPPVSLQSPSLRIRMITGVARDDQATDPLIATGDRRFVAGDGSLTAVSATGRVTPALLGTILTRISNAGITPHAVSADREQVIVLVERADGPALVRAMEETLIPGDSNDSSR